MDSRLVLVVLVSLFVVSALVMLWFSLSGIGLPYGGG